MKSRFAAVLLLAMGILFPSTELFSCSTYKLTAHGKTMVGSNYDSWFINPIVWFETEGYGAEFSGARREDNGAVAPQTGMNVYGLAFVTLAAPPQQSTHSSEGRKQIVSRSSYLKSILHSCKTVEQVKTYIEQYDHSVLFDEVFLYTDSSGNYLVVEPNVLTLGHDAYYVLANFCPSTITDFSSIKQQRYINGSAFVRSKIDSSLAFCRAMSDTMHVCREKVGDGTLLTSILDLQQGIIHFYFYHDYQHHAQLNLLAELAKGDHQIEITSLFPVNEEYEKFLAYKTPATSDAALAYLYSLAALLFISGVIFFISFMRSRGERYRSVKLLLLPLCWILSYYALILSRKDGIFYFPAPYEDYEFSILTVAAYIPFLLLAAIVPLALLNRKVVRTAVWGKFMRTYFTGINIVFVLVITSFTYWGLYSVF